MCVCVCVYVCACVYICVCIYVCVCVCVSLSKMFPSGTVIFLDVYLVSSEGTLRAKTARVPWATCHAAAAAGTVTC